MLYRALHLYVFMYILRETCTCKETLHNNGSIKDNFLELIKRL